MSLQLDNRILELRLLYKDSVISLPSITKCANKLQLYSKDKNNKLLLENFLNEILLCKLEIDKAMKIFNTLELQKIEYDHLENKIENLIDITKNNIILSEKELIEQKEIRMYRLRSEQVAAQVNEYPTRTLLKRKIDEQNISLNNTKSAIDQVNLEIETKKNLLDQLFKAIDELQKQPEIDNILSHQVMDIDEENVMEEDMNIDRTSNNRINNSNELVVDDNNNIDDTDVIEDSTEVVLNIHEYDGNDEMKTNIICDICQQEYQLGTICQVCEGK